MDIREFFFLVASIALILFIALGVAGIVLFFKLKRQIASGIMRLSMASLVFKALKSFIRRI